MFELLIGLLLGTFSGLLTSFIPANLNTFLFILLTNSPSNFLVGFIVGLESVQVLTKHLSILNPSITAAEGNVFLAPELPTLINQGLGMSAIKTAWFHAFWVRVTILMIGCVLILIQQQSILKIALPYQVLSIGVALPMWGTLALRSKSPITSILTMLLSISIAYLTIKLPGTNQMIGAAIAMVGVPVAIQTIQQERTNLPPQLPGAIEGTISAGFIITGTISSLWMGLPTSGLLSAFQPTKSTPIEKVIQSSTAETASQSIGLLMALTQTGSRSASAAYLSQSTLTPITLVALLIFSLYITFLVYQQQAHITALYLQIISKMTPWIWGWSMIIVSVSSAFYFLNWSGIILIASGMLIHQILIKTHTPQSASLVGISSIPLWGFFGV